MRKGLVCLFLFFAGVGVFFTGCSGSASSEKESAGELNLFIWTEYMPASVLDAFERETGIKINMSTYSSNEDLLAKVKSGGDGIYDVVVPSDYMVKMMINEGLLLELDKTKLNNIENVEQAYLNRYYDLGNKFSIPYMGGVMAIAVNKTKIASPIASVSDLFGEEFRRNLVVLDDNRAIIGAVSKSLGYSLNPATDEEFEAIESKLLELKPNIKLRDSDSPKTAMLNGETAAGLMWSAEIAICMQESSNFTVVFPKEGCYVFMDNLTILKTAKNVENAEKFINFVLRPDISKMISDEYPYLNPNKAALPLLTDSYKNNPASNIAPEVFRNGEFVQDAGLKVEKYDELWTKFTK
ncbi:MAG: spermidine/putrescine ABC transporter substrate-binding protein [Elusimicrobiota bacterium]|jgi:spermidine/putrescine-binding protein|nr:spermidine/putrescine ABC transporter substrate-binding protein [Elusimicrobiota bacterium]